MRYCAAFILLLLALEGCGTTAPSSSSTTTTPPAPVTNPPQPPSNSNPVGGSPPQTPASNTSLPAPIVVQPAEWLGMSTPAPAGTRSNAPVTFGVGIPDSAGIDCPGTQNLPGNELPPSKLALQNS